MQQLEGRNMSEIDTAVSTDGVKLFRNLFIHLKLNQEKGSSFELGATEVMPQDNYKLVENLVKLLVE